MPWRKTAPMSERMRFVTDWERNLYSMVELCTRYGVSRKTRYKWVARFEGEGVDGLRERRRAPHHCPHRISAEVAQAICAGRRQHLTWGPEKILHWLKRHQPTMAMPATSTNDLWTADFKAHFRTRDGVYCYPLTVADHRPRYSGLAVDEMAGRPARLRAPLPRVRAAAGHPNGQ